MQFKIFFLILFQFEIFKIGILLGLSKTTLVLPGCPVKDLSYNQYFEEQKIVTYYLNGLHTILVKLTL